MDPKLWSVWVVQAYGTIGRERQLDRIEEKCIQDLKNKQIIR